MSSLTFRSIVYKSFIDNQLYILQYKLYMFVVKRNREGRRQFGFSRSFIVRSRHVYILWKKKKKKSEIKSKLKKKNRMLIILL